MSKLSKKVLSRLARFGARRRGPSIAQLRKAQEIERLNLEGIDRIGLLDNQAFLVAGIALYAAEGAKTDGVVKFANSDPFLIGFFCKWFRTFFQLTRADSADIFICTRA